MMFDVDFSRSYTTHFVDLLNLWCKTFLIFRKCQPFIYSNIVPFPLCYNYICIHKRFPQRYFKGLFFLLALSFTMLFWILFCYIFKFLTLFIYTCYYLHSVYFSSYHHVFQICSGFPLLKHIKYSYTKILNRLVCQFHLICHC